MNGQPPHRHSYDTSTRNDHTRAGMSSSSTGRALQDVSNAMIYSLVMKTDARLYQDIGRLEVNMREIRSLIISALYPTSDHDNNSPSRYMRNGEEFGQEDDLDGEIHRRNQGAPNFVETDSHSSLPDEAYSISTGNETPLETMVESAPYIPDNTFHSGVRDPLASHPSSIRDVSNEQDGYGGDTPVSVKAVLGDSVVENRSYSGFQIGDAGVQGTQVNGVPSNDTVPTTSAAVSVNVSTEYEDDDVIFDGESDSSVVARPIGIQATPPPANDPTSAMESNPSTSNDSNKPGGRRPEDNRRKKTRGFSTPLKRVEPGSSKNLASFSSSRQTRPCGIPKTSSETANNSNGDANKMQNVFVKKDPHYCTRKRVTDTGERRFECVCGFTTNNKVYMNRHTTVNSLARFLCPLCRGLFATCSYVRKHLVNEHMLRDLPPRLLKCRRCLKVFLKKEDKPGHKNQCNKLCMPRKLKKQEDAQEPRQRTPSITISMGPGGSDTVTSGS